MLGKVMVIKRDRVAPASHFGIFSAQNPLFVKVKGWLTSLLYPRGLTMWLPIPNCGRQPSEGCRETSPSGLDGQFRGKNTKAVLMDNFECDDIARFLAEDCHIL